MFGRLDKEAIRWVAGTTVVGCVVLGWVFVSNWSGDQSNRASLGLNEPAEMESKPIEDRNLGVHVGKTQDSKSVELVGTIRLLEDCSENSEESSEECIQLLDSHFLQKPAVHPALGWIDFPNSPTYSSIFADPEGDRERTFAALERSECRLENGKEFPVDLKETCEAGAIARFSVFLQVCHSEGGATNLRDFLISQGFQRLRIRDILAREGADEVDRRLALETRFERQWKSEKCRNLDFPYKLSQTRDAPQIARLDEIGRRFGLTHTDLSESDYAEILMLLADRLGAEESVSSIYSPLAGYRSTEWDEHVVAIRPWLSPWTRMMFSFERKQSMLAAIDLAIALRDVGADFEMDHLVEMICKGDYGDQLSCQAVLDEIKPTIDWSKNEELQVLDEFETRALQLGLYD